MEGKINRPSDDEQYYKVGKTQPKIKRSASRTSNGGTLIQINYCNPELRCTTTLGDLG